MSNINQLVLELKNKNEDFEFYPSTEEMIKTIFYDCYGGGSWLDIGCGTCNLKKWINKFAEQEKIKEEQKENIWRANNFDDKFNFKRNNPSKINEYYVIEKSKTLVEKFDKDTICLGRDFNCTDLYDKPTNYIFCNPPYSQYAEWTCKILEQGAFRNCAYMIIPSRWEDNQRIKDCLEQNKTNYIVLGSSDFYDAERKARAVVDIVKFKRDKYYSRVSEKYNEKVFDKFFDSFFSFKKEKSYEEKNEELNKQRNQIVCAESKVKMLVDMYNEEFKTLNNHFLAIANLDPDVLETIGVKKDCVKKALKNKRETLKIKYWKFVFEQFEEITDRLTTNTCDRLFKKFQNINAVDFTPENIYPIVIWVINNANSYYDKQLLEFYDNMTTPDNICNYKSNHKVFKRCEYRPECFDNKEEVSHYTLHYRVVCPSNLFPNRDTYYSRYNKGYMETIMNICVIARNLGFTVDKSNFDEISNIETGKKANIYQENGKILFEFKHYMNGNKHIKFNVELMKAINVEVARLRNWIQTKEDIAKEFNAEMASGAEKYFKTNMTISLTNNNIKLLTTNY